jgi:hypothetical protein
VPEKEGKKLSVSMVTKKYRNGNGFAFIITITGDKHFFGRETVMSCKIKYSWQIKRRIDNGE